MPKTERFMQIMTNVMTRRC